MKVTPASTAAWRTARASSSLTLPQSPPSCHAPRPTTPTVRPVRPSLRCSMAAHLNGAAREEALRPAAADGRGERRPGGPQRTAGAGRGLRPVAEGPVGREAVDAVHDALEQRVRLRLRQVTGGDLLVELLLRLRAGRGAHVGQCDALRVRDLLEGLTVAEPAEELSLAELQRLGGRPEDTALGAEAEARTAGPGAAAAAEEEAAAQLLDAVDDLRELLVGLRLGQVAGADRLLELGLRRPPRRGTHVVDGDVLVRGDVREGVAVAEAGEQVFAVQLQRLGGRVERRVGGAGVVAEAEPVAEAVPALGAEHEPGLGAARLDGVGLVLGDLARLDGRVELGVLGGAERAAELVRGRAEPARRVVEHRLLALLRGG